MRCQRTMGNDIDFSTFLEMEMDKPGNMTRGFVRMWQAFWNWWWLKFDVSAVVGGWLVLWVVSQPSFTKQNPNFVIKLQTLLTFWFSTCLLFDTTHSLCVVLVWCSVEQKKKDFIFKFNLTKETEDSSSSCIAIIESNHI